MTEQEILLNVEKLRSVNLYLNMVLDYDDRIDVQNTIASVMDSLRSHVEGEDK
jgi:hypothetical protein